MSDQDDVVAQYVSGFEAWNAHDADRIFDESGDGALFGFGFRDRDVRAGRTVEQQRQGLKAWFGSFDWYRIDDIDVHCSVDGDIATVWGFFTEDYQHKGQDPERVRVRSSAVLHRLDGGWQQIWSHRDAQEFAEDGSYIRKPIQDA